MVCRFFETPELLFTGTKAPLAAKEGNLRVGNFRHCRFPYDFEFDTYVAKTSLDVGEDFAGRRAARAVDA